MEKIKYLDALDMMFDNVDDKKVSEKIEYKNTGLYVGKQNKSWGLGKVGEINSLDALDIVFGETEQNDSLSVGIANKNGGK